MKQTHILLLVLIFIHWNKINGQTTTSNLQASVNAGIDPYFVETRDTVFTRGFYTITRSELQDRNGDYWFATWQGIIKYDGKVFTNMTLKEGLIHFHVLSIFEDKKGNLWFGTVRGGLYHYSLSPATGEKPFTLFTEKDGLTDNTVVCMLHDKDGNIWLGTDKGVSRYNPSAKNGEKAFTAFTPPNGPGSNSINSIVQDKTGKIWFAGTDGITCYDPSVTDDNAFTTFTNQDGRPFEKVTRLMEDRTGRIWIGRMEGGGLCCYDPTAEHSKAFTSFMTNFIGYMFEDKKGNLWFTVTEINQPASQYEKPKPHQVLYRYDGASFTKVIDKYHPWDFQVFGIMEDKTGDIWFGTMKGAGRYDGKYAHYYWE